MKKFKKISIALASMLLMFSMASAVTGTVAWFTAANTVSVSSMSIKAEVEQGIVIANETHAAAADWDLSATASHNGTVGSPAAQAAFIPTSTANASNWYHANSTNFNDAGAGQADDKYTALAPTQNGTSGVFDATIGSASKHIYLKNTFYIQSSSTKIENQDIYLTALAVEGSSSSPELNKSLRLAVVYNSNVKVFGLFTGYTASYKVGGATGGTSVSAVPASGSTKVDVATNVDIPAYTVNSSNLQFDTYLYFEGEDAACTSANAAVTLDTLSVSFQFGNEAAA